MHAHFVIAYDPIEIISNTAFNDDDEATGAYLEAEERYRDHEGLEVVMLSYTSDPTTSRVVRTIRHRQGDTPPDWLGVLAGRSGVRA